MKLKKPEIYAMKDRTGEIVMYFSDKDAALRCAADTNDYPKYGQESLRPYYVEAINVIEDY